jgi:hypothetical protein
VLKFFLIGIMGIVLGACSSFSDSEVIMKTNSEKRKPRHDYMPPEEKPVDDHSSTNKHLPIAPQLGIRIPLGK